MLLLLTLGILYHIHKRRAYRLPQDCVLDTDTRLSELQREIDGLTGRLSALGHVRGPPGEAAKLRALVVHDEYVHNDVYTEILAFVNAGDKTAARKCIETKSTFHFRRWLEGLGR